MDSMTRTHKIAAGILTAAFFFLALQTFLRTELDDPTLRRMYTSPLLRIEFPFIPGPYATVAVSLIVPTVLSIAFWLAPREPKSALFAVMAAATVPLIVPLPGSILDQIVAILVVAYYIGNYTAGTTRAQFVVWWFFGLGGIIYFLGIYPDYPRKSEQVVPVVLLMFSLMVIPSVTLFTFGSQNRKRSTELVIANERAEYARSLERQRIARDMHDVVSHNLSSVIVLADGARFAARKNPDAAIEALTTISATSREALGQMRGLVSALRDDDENEVPTSSATMSDLISEARFRGLALDVTGELPGGLTPMTHMTAYRLVQEAITNMMRHGTDQGTLELTSDDDTLTITASNPIGDTHEPRGGYGLVGMRERIQAAGGTLAITNDGSIFTLKAVLPR